MNYLNLTFRSQKNCHCQKNTWYRETILQGKKYAKFSCGLLVDSSWIRIIFSPKDLRFCLSYKTSKECLKRSIQLQTGKIFFFMIFSINSFHSILSTSKKWRLRLMMIDVLIYYLLIWKPIQDQSLVCLDRRARRQQPAFYVVLSILVMFFHQLSYCLLPVLILLQQLFAITVLFLFFPLRGLSIFTRPNELLNAEELYPNLFAVKKWNMTFIYLLRGRVLSSADDIWKLKLEIKKERY